MSLDVWLTGGTNLAPAESTWGGRIASRLGRWLALRHDHVKLDPTCRISPTARIHPRKGAITVRRGSTVAPGAVIQGNVSMGENCSLQIYSILVGYGTCENPSGAIRIGNNVRIAAQVMMIAANHIFDDPERTITSQGLRHAPITIEDDVWIGGRVTVMAGVTIGTGSVIGAGSVVTRDIPPWSVAVGVPARVIKSRR